MLNAVQGPHAIHRNAILAAFTAWTSISQKIREVRRYGKQNCYLNEINTLPSFGNDRESAISFTVKYLEHQRVRSS